MNIKEFKGLEPKVEFIKLGSGVCFKFENNMYKFDNDTMEYLNKKLELPYKVSFYGLSRANIGRILSYLKDDDNEIFWYRVKNPKNNVFIFHAIIREKIKIKKI